MTRSFIGHQPFKGRGAASNPAVRFEATTREQIHDGWYEDEIVEHLSETVLPIARAASSPPTSPRCRVRSIDQSLSRLQPRLRVLLRAPDPRLFGPLSGLDFETKLFYKADAVKILEAELARPKYVCKPIALASTPMGINRWKSGCRSPRHTRRACPVPAPGHHRHQERAGRARHRFADGPRRDRLVSVMVSITSLTGDIKRTLEPRTASPQARLRVVQQLARAGFRWACWLRR